MRGIDVLDMGEDDDRDELDSGGVALASCGPNDGDVSLELDGFTGTGVGDEDAGGSGDDEDEAAEVLRSRGFFSAAAPPSPASSALRARFFSFARRFWNHTCYGTMRMRRRNIAGRAYLDPPRHHP